MPPPVAPSSAGSAGLGPPDPRTAASLLAVDRALEWYLKEVALAKAPPVSEADARALRDCLAGRRRWAPENFDRLVTFAQAMYRLGPLDAAVPTCNLGDCLTSLSRAAVVAPDAEPWRFDARVQPEVFGKLEFRETSLGIARAQREHREGWWAHAQKNRAFIEAAAGQVARTDLAVVLGAGNAFDLPLATLARRFSRLVLVDIDGEALTETAAALASAAVETAVVDLTGINSHAVGRIEETIATAADAEAAATALMALARSYRLPALPQIPPRVRPDGGEPSMEQADLLVSSCVLSQLAWPQRVFAERLFEARFGPMSPALETPWSTAWTEFGLRVQQDHVNALGESARTVVLTSDVMSHQTVWDARSGSEKPQGKKIFPLAVESLLERIPRFYKKGAQSRWKWSRYRASRKGSEGSVMDVEGVVLTESTTTGGLWLPD